MDAVPPSPHRWQLGPRGRRVLDATLATGLLLPVLVFPVAGLPLSWVVLGITQIVPLYWRRRHPVPVFGAVAAASAAQVLVVDTPLWSQVAFPVAIYSVARFSGSRWPTAALGVGLVAAVVASVDWLRGFGVDVTAGNFGPYVLSISAIVVAAWALGTQGRIRQAYVDALVERSQRIEREAAQQVELAAGQERARIAREMHDVVAHGLSVIVVQADGARYAAARDPQVATRTLGTIADTGREALTEMRRLLGLLRDGEAPGARPQPRLEDVAVLVEEARAAGTDIRADLPDRVPDVPAGVALTAYRVVQEALSNVRKHAGPGAAATVTVAVDDDLVVVVEDDGRGAAAPTDGSGLGLIGMRERVGVHDGMLEAGARPGGGFRVAARIPR